MVVGSGGREHALLEALARSPLQPELYAAPGNPGMARIAHTVDISADDLTGLGLHLGGEVLGRGGGLDRGLGPGGVQRQ